MSHYRETMNCIEVSKTHLMDGSHSREVDFGSWEGALTGDDGFITEGSATHSGGKIDLALRVAPIHEMGWWVLDELRKSLAQPCGQQGQRINR